MELLYVYLITVNALTFLLFAIDKYKAIARRNRIREANLFLLSLVGGAMGGYLAMLTFRHKTQTAVFKFGLPIIIILYAVAAYLKIDI